MTSRAVTSWMEALGTRVLVKALEMVIEMAWNERVVSLPPVGCKYMGRISLSDAYL